MSANQPASLGAAAVRPIGEPVEIDWLRLNTIAAVLLVVGLVGFAIVLIAGESDRVWPVWLVNVLYFLGIAHAGVVCSCAYYLVQGRWAGTVSYRLAEAFAPFLGLGFVLFW